MEQQNKYYIPSIEELHVGYCNYQVCYKEGAWTDMLPIVDGIQIDNIADLLSGRVGYNVGTHVRTKWLDREDVESCGWVFMNKSDDAVFYTLSTGNEQRDTIENRWRLRTEIGTRIWITQGYDWSRFLGTCSSINELRTIMRLLNIQ